MYRITLENRVEDEFSPDKKLLLKWAKTTLKKQLDSAILTIRITDEKEMAKLNETYRRKQGPTNVLSFPFLTPNDIELKIPILGDLIICAAVVNREAKEQHKMENAHWAHMIVHGIFHLLGYDHQTNEQAKEMETLEITTMKQLGFDNPYEE